MQNKNALSPASFPSSIAFFKMSQRVSKPTSKPSRGKKIPDEKWDNHRTEILRLWLADGNQGKTLDEIVDIMREKHNFIATYVRDWYWACAK